MRPIDAYALVEEIESLDITVAGKPARWNDAKHTVLRKISEQAAADVAPVRHGRWVLGHVEPGYCTPGGNRPWICPECGTVVSWRLDKPQKKYCSECGLKMDLEATDES